MGGLLGANPLYGMLSQPQGALYQRPQGLLGSGLRQMTGMGLAPYGLRHSGEGAKGLGFFGALPHQGGGYSTEISSEFEHNGKSVEHPLLVPTLDVSEIKHLLSGQEPTEAIYEKARAFALQRANMGLNPFAGPQDLRYPMPR
jgi:hypothetical protein